MDNTNHEGERHLYIVWEERFCRRVFRVNGNIEFEDGRATFKLIDGTTVRIKIDQILTIGITGNIDIEQFRTVENHNDAVKSHENTDTAKNEVRYKDNITPLFPEQ